MTLILSLCSTWHHSGHEGILFCWALSTELRGERARPTLESFLTAPPANRQPLDTNHATLQTPCRRQPQRATHWHRATFRPWLGRGLQPPTRICGGTDNRKCFFRRNCRTWWRHGPPRVPTTSRTCWLHGDTCTVAELGGSAGAASDGADGPAPDPNPPPTPPRKAQGMSGQTRKQKTFRGSTS